MPKQFIYRKLIVSHGHKEVSYTLYDLVAEGRFTEVEKETHVVEGDPPKIIADRFFEGEYHHEKGGLAKLVEEHFAMSEGEVPTLALRRIYELGQEGWEIVSLENWHGDYEDTDAPMYSTTTYFLKKEDFKKKGSNS